jgi:hypothetical protein
VSAAAARTRNESGQAAGWGDAAAVVYANEWGEREREGEEAEGGDGTRGDGACEATGMQV